MQQKLDVSKEKHKNKNVDIEEPQLRFPEFSSSLNNLNLSELSDISTGNKDLKDNKKEGKYPFFVRSQQVERIDSYSFDGEAILIPGDGVGVGKIYHYINGKFDYHQRVYKISDFDNRILGKYIYYYLSEKFLRQVHRNSQKASVDSLRLPTIKNMKINFPNDIEEQNKIVKFLTTVDKKIELLEKTLVLYQKDINYNINNIYSNLNPTKELKINDIFENYSSNLSINQLEENSGDYSLYGAEGIIKGIDFYEMDRSYISIIKDGAGVGRLNLCEPNSSTLGTLQCLIPKDEYDINFLYFYLKTLNFNKYVVGSTIPHIYFKDYSKEKLIIPPLNIQNSIGTYFLELKKRNNLIKNKIEQLELFKKGLLQRMFV